MGTVGCHLRVADRHIKKKVREPLIESQIEQKH
jgi:hypothetical protein